MTRESVVIESDILDHIEELLEIRADGYHIPPASDDEQEQYEDMLADIRNTRP
jgi:hypothetical protein